MASQARHLAAAAGRKDHTNDKHQQLEQQNQHTQHEHQHHQHSRRKQRQHPQHWPLEIQTSPEALAEPSASAMGLPGSPDTPVTPLASPGLPSPRVAPGHFESPWTSPTTAYAYTSTNVSGVAAIPNRVPTSTAPKDDSDSADEILIGWPLWSWSPQSPPHEGLTSPTTGSQ